jgi:Holliday junction DNA helicase RuvA
MIAFLRGLVLSKVLPTIVIDVNGVGYEVETSLTTYLQVPEAGQPVELHIHLHLREDAFALYGFYTDRERALFRRLLKISGVGPKVALGILSSSTPDQFVCAVLSHDVQTLTRLPGIGKKTAERLILEMKDGLSEWQYDRPAMTPQGLSAGTNAQPNRQQELLEALNALGFKRQEALQMLKKLNFSESVSIEELLREALQQVS